MRCLRSARTQSGPVEIRLRIWLRAWVRPLRSARVCAQLLSPPLRRLPALCTHGPVRSQDYHLAMNTKRDRWGLAGVLGLWGGVGVVVGSGVNIAEGGHSPWLIAAVPLVLDTAIGLYLGFRQRR